MVTVTLHWTTWLGVVALIVLALWDIVAAAKRPAPDSTDCDECDYTQTVAQKKCAKHGSAAIDGHGGET